MRQGIKVQGFTVMESLLVVLVLGMLTTLAFPDIISFFDRQESQMEKAELKEIQNALESFVKDNGGLPLQATWFTDISGYTQIPVNRLQFDRWGAERQYKVFSRNENFRGTLLLTSYAVVYSYGPDGLIDQQVIDDGLLDALEPTNANDPLEDFPADVDDALVAYRNVEELAGGNDQLVKFTDRSLKIEAYGKLQDRLDHVQTALVNYARSRLNISTISGEAGVENKVFYPPSGVDGGEVYANPVIVDADTFLGDSNGTFDPATERVSVLEGSAANDNARRNSMIALMRILGLPDAYCCNPLSLVDTTGDTVPDAEAPFFYFSNPRRITPAGCSARPTVAPFNPPRITTENVADASVDPPPTCG